MIPHRHCPIAFATLAGLTLAAGALAQTNDITQLDPVTVFAGQFPTGDQPAAVLTALDVVRTPGANADINRALQTLPGIQTPDEGNALFVRGGDSFETGTFVNGLRFPSATRLNAPAGNFAGTLNPFDARRIDFATGGFSARFGNALSGIVDLETQGSPGVHSGAIGGGLGAVSAGANVAFNEHAGIRLSATRMNTAPIFRLNGANRDYPEPANGHDQSATAAWEYRRGAEVKFFAVEQARRFALRINQPAQHGVFRMNSLNRLGTVSWSDSFGAWKVHADTGGSTNDRTEAVAGGAVQTSSKQAQFSSRVSFDARDWLQLSGGVETTHERDTIAKSFPVGGDSAVFAAKLFGSHWGAFSEADAAIAPRVRLIAGARVDRSSLTRQTSTDPRVSIAWQPRRDVTVSLASGVYHQIPDAYHFISDTGRITQPPMRATQALAGLQLGRDDKLARLEIYTKDYANLIALDRSYRAVGGGTGQADGLDLLLKSPLPLATRGRLTYSYVDTRRTDPDTGRVTRAPFDVTHTAALLLDRAFGDWVASAAWRYASGRPITPVVGGAADGRGGFSPIYGAPFSTRLPALHRLDLSASRYLRLNTHTSLVLYVSLNNVLNRANVYDYEYSADFASRQPTPSLFQRSVYFGFTLLFN